MSDKNSFYITASLPYLNASPHAGHAYESVLADIIARYKRSQKIETFFLIGTDEHGDKVLRASQKEGENPQFFVDKFAQQFKELYKKLKISNDDFIRTSNKEKHWPGAIQIWKNLEKKGDIYRGLYKGLYCVGCEEFITEKQLVDGKCPLHNKPPEKIEEENYFFRLSKYAGEIKKLIGSDELYIFPEVRKNEMLAVLESEIKDISFSRPERDIMWGIPVPDSPGQNMYVWCDALTNYVSALGYGTNEDDLFKKFWPADVHLLGKDILKFHAIYWPAMLLSAGLSLPKSIWVHGFITSEGRKMSKSIGNVIDPTEYIDNYGSEAFRYYLAREISPFEDGDFTKEKFIEAYNANLANGLGNLVSRTFKMAKQYFDGTVERRLSVDIPLHVKRGTISGVEKLDGYSIPHIVLQNKLSDYRSKMDVFDVQQATDVVWDLIGLLDGYITDYEPFKLIKKDRDRTENILWNVLYGIYFVAEMLEPVLPDTAGKIKNLMEAVVKDGEPVSFQIKELKEPLFKRI